MKILCVFTGGTIGSSVQEGLIATDERAPFLLLEKYRAACRALNGVVPTDDAEIMRLSGFPVELVDSGQWNMKLTSPGDLEKLRMMLAGGGNE